MQKSFKQRLAELERLEAAQEAKAGRGLELWVQMRPADYFTLYEDDDAPIADRVQLWHAYGFDQLQSSDRVHILGGTWPGVRRACDQTIARVAWDDGYGYWLDLAPWVDVPPGETRWDVSITDEVTARCRAYRESLLAEVIAAVEAGIMGVRSFNAVCDLRTQRQQITTAVWRREGDPRLHRLCDVLRNTLDLVQIVSGGPFVQSGAGALAVLRGLGPDDVWTSQQAVWPQRDKLIAQQ